MMAVIVPEKNQQAGMQIVLFLFVIFVQTLQYEERLVKKSWSARKCNEHEQRMRSQSANEEV
jgi:hypothetical protein